MADIIEILQEIGAEKLGAQRLSSVLEGNQVTRKDGGARISFACTDVTVRDLIPPGTRDALVVWMDTKELDDALARIKARNSTTQNSKRGEDSNG